MAAKVDTGEIISVKRFPVYETDTVYSITQRCYIDILTMFYEILYLIINGEILPSSHASWERKPFLRKELNELCRLTPDMDVEEIERRIKATNYLQPWAYLQIGDKEIKLKEEDIMSKSYLKYLSPSKMS
jgi:methionyl-tRNA formyltransferase